MQYLFEIGTGSEFELAGKSAWQGEGATQINLVQKFIIKIGRLLATTATGTATRDHSDRFKNSKCEWNVINIKLRISYSFRDKRNILNWISLW